nr:ATP/GTP-binding protein [Streptomyces coryli]
MSKPDGTVPAPRPGGRYVERAELVLAETDSRPLHIPTLDPDPLQQLAAIITGVDAEAGEGVDVAIDLVPVTPKALERRRKKEVRASRRGPTAYGESLTTGGGSGGGAILGSLSSAWSGGTKGGHGGGRRQRMPRQSDIKEAVGKFTRSGGPFFHTQILLRTTATHPGQAAERMHRLLTLFAGMADENRLVVRRPKYRRQIVSFDERMATGRFRPARRQWLSAGELLGFLKPPTAKCTARNVARISGVIAPAPAKLPVYTGQPDLYPLGLATYPDGIERMAAVRLVELLFALELGKSGFGKTERALIALVALAYAGVGCWFLDPHGEAWERVRPYLARAELHDRMQAITLTTPQPDTMVVSWNPLSMTGRTAADIEHTVKAVVDGIAAGMSWGDAHPRARTVLAKTVEALCELSLRLNAENKPELQPTIFQIRSWLTKPAWREALLPLLPERVQAYWHDTFPNIDASGMPTVTYAIDQLDVSMALRCFFGSPQGGYDARHAMDHGKIMFVCPSVGGDDHPLVDCLLIHDLYRAGRSRQDTPRHLRKTFFAWIDELTAVDNSTKGFVAAICEQLRKYEVHLIGMTQMMMRLTDPTRRALLQNSSLLATTNADVDEAAVIAKRLDGVSAEDITALGQYEYLMRLMLDGRPTHAFKIRGVPLEDFHASRHNPAGLPALDKAIDRGMTRRPAKEIEDGLATLDADIFRHFADLLDGDDPTDTAVD